MKKNVESIVSEIASPIVEQVGVELYDVEYIKEGGQWYLRVYIDSPEGIDIDQCEAVSRLLDPALDKADPIREAYILEVSSVGLDRPLKKEKDFLYFMGEMIEVRLYKPYEGQKEFVGRLIDFAEGSFTVEVGENTITFTQKEAALVRLHIEF